MRVLITNPEVDAFTRYLCRWTGKMLGEFRNDINVNILDKDKAKRKRFEGTLSKTPVDVVLLNGHGDYSYVLGDNEIIVDMSNVDILKNKVVHAMSCSSARDLGRMAIRVGARAYVGYDEPFLASRMQDKISDPLNDDAAALFLDPAFIAQKALLNGKEPKEAVRLAGREYDRSIVKALRSPVQSNNNQLVGLLLWDKEHLVALE